MRRTIMLAPGHCKRIGHTKVCARAAKTTTTTTTTTTTVAVSGIGKAFTGNGDSTLAPLTLATGDEVHSTAQPDSGGDNSFIVSSDPNDPPLHRVRQRQRSDERIDVHPGRDVHVRGRRECDLVALVLTRR